MTSPTSAETQACADEVARLISTSTFLPGDQSFIYLMAFFRVRAHMILPNAPPGKGLIDAYELILCQHLPDLAPDTAACAFQFEPRPFDA